MRSTRAAHDYQARAGAARTKGPFELLLRVLDHQRDGKPYPRKQRVAPWPRRSVCEAHSSRGKKWAPTLDDRGKVGACCRPPPTGYEALNGRALSL